MFRIFSSNFLNQNFSGCFDTSGFMMPRLVPEILPCDGFCDEQEQEEQESCILGVRIKNPVVLTPADL